MGLAKRLREKYQKSGKDRTDVLVVLAFILVPFVGMGLLGLYVFLAVL